MQLSKKFLESAGNVNTMYSPPADELNKTAINLGKFIEIVKYPRAMSRSDTVDFVYKFVDESNDLLWNSIIRAIGENFMVRDAKDAFYLAEIVDIVLEVSISKNRKIDSTIGMIICNIDNNLYAFKDEDKFTEANARVRKLIADYTFGKQSGFNESHFAYTKADLMISQVLTEATKVSPNIYPFKDMRAVVSDHHELTDFVEYIKNKSFKDDIDLNDVAYITANFKKIPMFVEEIFTSEDIGNEYIMSPIYMLRTSLMTVRNNYGALEDLEVVGAKVLDKLNAITPSSYDVKDAIDHIKNFIDTEFFPSIERFKNESTTKLADPITFMMGDQINSIIPEDHALIVDNADNIMKDIAESIDFNQVYKNCKVIVESAVDDPKAIDRLFLNKRCLVRVYETLDKVFKILASSKPEKQTEESVSKVSEFVSACCAYILRYFRDADVINIKSEHTLFTVKFKVYKTVSEQTLKLYIGDPIGGVVPKSKESVRAKLAGIKDRIHTTRNKIDAICGKDS